MGGLHNHKYYTIMALISYCEFFANKMNIKYRFGVYLWKILFPIELHLRTVCADEFFKTPKI